MDNLVTTPAERSRTTTADHVVAILDQEVTATPFDPDACLHARHAAIAPMPRVVALSGEIPAAVSALHGYEAVMFETYGGDAACSIHSVYGESRGGFIRMEHPRQFLRNAFGETSAEFAGRVQDPDLVADLAGILWQDLLKPCVHRAVHGDGPVRPEGEAVWRELMARTPLIAQKLLDAFLSDEDAHQYFWQKRLVVVQQPFASARSYGARLPRKQTHPGAAARQKGCVP